jgi:hypothetical protein
MRPDIFAGVVIALARVTAIAERLHDGDDEGRVRRSIDDFAVAFARREAIGPAVASMRNSIVMLHDGGGEAVPLDASEGDKSLIEDLDAAIERQLLPELRRLGFELSV